ncbi:ABC transporter substrate-binding protein [Actinobacteria bacterium YIM 96077]|uniref:Solute-binding protein family 5 domain-containing protein n=1 Tax=Phytoactinopolyspora halophila TaxID=1981511 RepID=A0A329QJY5_9ACTN|nr:ABC transporter substrate-binding protein [Phytoactinopolyspora halophila]AYY12412.1 ABC transporter substrate-binding protein [Actinobacteria bacterium YIM 96077]RAW12009.1 hypothetical protein DPM12_15155 [Phytoactinopolyspora halophila]
MNLGALGLAPAAVSILIIAACSGPNDNDTSDGGAESGSEQTLQLGNPDEPPDLLPYDSHGGKEPVFAAILTPLIWVDSAGEWHSELLESWEVSDDGLTVTLEMNSGLEWTDGTAVTSADVALTLEHNLDPQVSVRAGSLAGVVGAEEFLSGETEEIAGLTTPDEHTVVIELESPSVWLQDMARERIFVVPEHVLGDVPHDDLNDHEYFSSFPVSNGPYKFVEWESGQHIELERSDQWSLGEAGFSRLFIKYLPGDVANAQLETGELHYYDRVDPSDADRIAEFEHVEIQSTTGVSQSPVWGLMYNEPLLDERVRQAMAHAIDRKGICEAAFNGFCTVPETNIPHIAPEWALPDSGITVYDYDPERAKELLKQADWNSENELIFLSWSEPGGPRDRALEIAQANMADVGINWTIENVDLPTMNERNEESPESFHGWEGAGGNFAVDPNFVRELTACDKHFPMGANRGHYCNEELDDLWSAGSSETDQEERARIYKDAFRILNEDVPNIWMIIPDNIVAHDARLDGVNPETRVREIGDWSWEE